MSLSQINSRGISAFKHYFSGKAISLVLTLTYFLLLTRNLTVSDYSNYVTAIAITELFIGITTFGLDWLSAIEIPKVLTLTNLSHPRLVRNLLGLRFLSQIIFFAPLILITAFASHLTEVSLPLQLGIGYAMVEGIHRYVANSIFDSSLLQRTSKRMWVAKATFQLAAILIIWLLWPEWLSATTAILAEAFGSLLGLAIARPTLVTMFSATPIRVNRTLCRLLATPFGMNRKLVIGSYFASLLTWTTSISTFVVASRVLGGEDIAAIVGFCATLTSQLRRYLPTEMFLGVARAVIYARFASHRSNHQLREDLRGFFSLGISAVALVLALFSSLGVQIIEIMTNGKYSSSLPLLLVSLAGLIWIIGRRTTETAANALSATSSWTTVSALSVISLPLACIGFTLSDQPFVFVIGWVAADTISVVGLDLKLRRLRGVAAVSEADVMKFLTLSPLFLAGYWSTNQEINLISHMVIASTLFILVVFFIFQLGLINYSTCKGFIIRAQND